MKNTSKILLPLLMVAAGLTWYFMWRKEGLIKAEDMVSIDLGDKNRSLFLRAKMWGIAGNHEEIVLSKSNAKIANKAEDYIFFTSEVFYKVEKDTFILYAPKSSISEPNVKIQRVKINSLKRADEIRDYHINYKKYGLKRICVYK